LRHLTHSQTAQLPEPAFVISMPKRFGIFVDFASRKRTMPFFEQKTDDGCGAARSSDMLDGSALRRMDVAGGFFNPRGVSAPDRGFLSGRHIADAWFRVFRPGGG
jgi:hypothetical protein